MKNHRGQAEIIISDADDTEYTLLVDYEAHKESRDYYDNWTGWSPGDPAGVEIDGLVACLNIKYYQDYGDRPTMIINDKILQKTIGEILMEEFREEITEKVCEWANSAEDYED